MNKVLLLLIIITHGSCMGQKSQLLNSKIDSIQIDYVHMYTSTPMNVSLEMYYSYFGKSIHSILLKEKEDIDEMKSILNDFFSTAEKVDETPDLRIVITLHRHQKKQIILVGTTLVSTRGQGFYANDIIKKYFRKITNSH